MHMNYQGIRGEEERMDREGQGGRLPDSEFPLPDPRCLTTYKVSSAQAFWLTLTVSVVYFSQPLSSGKEIYLLGLPSAKCNFHWQRTPSC